MDHAAFEGEQNVTRITVVLILLDGVFGILLCELILQFHRDDWKTVDENAEIQSQLSCVLRVAELPSHAEDVLLVHFLLLPVVLRRREIEHNQVCRINLNAITKNIDNATLGQFSL